MPYIPLPVWEKHHVAALRALLRYAVGMSSPSKAVPGWAEYLFRLERDRNPNDAEGVIRTRIKHQFNHFKDGSNNFDVDDPDGQPRLEFVREALFNFFQSRRRERADMITAYTIVYGADDLSLADIRPSIKSIYKASLDSSALEHLPGVYRLYRFGTLDGPGASIVRSVLHISRVSGGDEPSYVFDIRYPVTSRRDAPDRQRLSGIVFEKLSHYYFLGADVGSGRAPYQLIAKVHGADEAPQELSGLQMRHGEQHEVLACRVLIVRTSKDRTGKLPAATYLAEFKADAEHAKVISPSEVPRETFLTRPRLASLSNAIEPAHTSVLWLSPTFRPRNHSSA